MLSFLVNCEKYLIFSVNCDTSVIFLNMGNSNKKNREKKCTSGIIRTFLNSHSMADASITCMWSHRVSTENVGCLFSKLQSGVATLE